MNKRLVKNFLLYTFLLSWISWGTVAILTVKKVSQYGSLIVMAGIILGGISPFIVANITKYKYNKISYRLFLRSHIKFKVNILWYVWVIIIPFVITIIPLFAEFFKTGSWKPVFIQPIYMILLQLPVMIIGGGLEESGWRGILLPELLRKTNKYWATITVALIWTIWHLPLWLVEGSNQFTVNILGFGSNILVMSFLFTILWVKTESIGMAILFHAFFNVYPFVINSGDANPYIVFTVKIVIALLLFFVILKDSTKKNASSNYNIE